MNASGPSRDQPEMLVLIRRFWPGGSRTDRRQNTEQEA
jgi:hypothetical protein